MLNSLVGIIASSGGAAGGTAYESIASATGTGSSGTITFSSIPSTYTSLQIRYNAITTAGQIMRIQFNSDTGTNYARHSLRGNGTTASATGNITSAFIAIGDTANGTNTTYATVGVTDIQDYASTTRNKTVRDFGGMDNNSTGAVCLSSGVWLNTAAITSITFFIPTDNFTTSTTVALYGIKGA
jgi:hypothetical protein